MHGTRPFLYQKYCTVYAKQMAVMSRPTGCRLAAASAGKASQNGNDLAREAVGWNPLLGGTCGVSLIGKQ
jgi:hypothetical protein